MSKTLSNNARIALISISIILIVFVAIFTRNIVKKSDSSTGLSILYFIILILYIVQLVKSIKTTADSSKIKTAHIVISAITFVIMIIYWVCYMLYTKNNIIFHNYFAK